MASSIAESTYLKPSALYPAALQYQLARGVIMFFSHGRFTMKLANDGWDMAVARATELYLSVKLASSKGCRWSSASRKWIGGLGSA
jgi:hypothetical protein